MHVQPLCYCMTFSSRKTLLLIYGKTNDAKIFLFITTTIIYKNINDKYELNVQAELTTLKCYSLQLAILLLLPFPKQAKS